MAALVELCLAARQEASVGSQVCTDDAERLRRQLGSLVADTGIVLVGFVDDQPAGFLLARLVGPSLFTDASAIVIEALYVVGSARRRGLGHVLLGLAANEAEARGACELFSSPLPGARGMQRFLARLGFTSAATHRVVTTSALQRRLAHDLASSTPGARRPAPRGLEDLIARRRHARESRRVPEDQIASTSMQVNLAVHTRRPSPSSTMIS
ncbi:GNAT family N-acetyltransferase [Cellulomonas composti]|uniref:N-acetyltransferase domain-containing protein n=1 Tax=Cellulomonas composti TaxID=266130 RepID=A0A511J6J5_9CELL|nr:GNAT family N-acetyltransferase [Cellulomonas composti]GEL93630.1 hypothetical protein CCO02nite_02880 [Cellulomonas composti]